MIVFQVFDTEEIMRLGGSMFSNGDTDQAAGSISCGSRRDFLVLAGVGQLAVSQVLMPGATPWPVVRHH
jgi:hypothetical protein